MAKTDFRTLISPPHTTISPSLMFMTGIALRMAAGQPAKTEKMAKIGLIVLGRSRNSANKSKRSPMILPSLHDSNLIGVHWQSDRLALDFDDNSSKKIRIELSGVQALRVDELREGNIVLEAILFDSKNSSLKESDITKWLEYLVVGRDISSCKAVEDANRKSVSNMLALIIAGKAQCFCLTPAYGGVIVCLHSELRYNA